MKRHTIIILALVFSMTLVGVAGAFEGASLLNQNSYGLYYREDPFDITLDPALLYQVDRWRLYTNLSNYEDANHYLIGTSGKLGPGSLGVFYETNKSLTSENDTVSNNSTSTDVLIPAGTSYNSGSTVTSTLDTRAFEDETTAHNFIVDYGMDLGIFSLGVAYTPEFSKRTVSLRRAAGIPVLGTPNVGGVLPDYTANPAAYTFPDHSETLAVGAGAGFLAATGLGDFSRSTETTVYGDTAHSRYNTRTQTDAFSGSNEGKDNTQGFVVGSQFHPSSQFDTIVNVGYDSIDKTQSGSARYTYANTETQTGAGAFTAGTDLQAQPGLRAAGYAMSESQISTWNGEFLSSLTDHALDGSRWNVAVTPSYRVNDVVGVEVGLGYAKTDGDVDGNWTQDVTISRSITPIAGDTTPETWNGTQAFDNKFNGTNKVTEYYVEPRVYFTYGPVDFSLGVGYARSKDEMSGRTNENGSTSWAYDNGDGIANAADWTATYQETSHYDMNYEGKTTTWSFPVATKFKVTDKLTFRAGARYSRINTVQEYNETDPMTDDASATITDGTGAIIGAGPGVYIPAGGVLTPYDPTHGTSRYGDCHETTVDVTSYRLGCGYQPTEHLQFDLMFDTAAGGGVNTTVVYASAVLAFN